MSRNLSRLCIFFEENLLEICFLHFLCLTDFYSGKGASKKSAKSFLVDLSFAFLIRNTFSLLKSYLVVSVARKFRFEFIPEGIICCNNMLKYLPKTSVPTNLKKHSNLM